MIKTILLAAITLATFTTESQARPQIWNFLGGVVVGSALANTYAYSAPPVYYVEQPRYYYSEPPVVYYSRPQRYCREPQVIYYSQPVYSHRRCR